MKPLSLLIVSILVIFGSISPVAAIPADDTSEPECAFPLEVTDASGETISLDEEPERVVTLNPSAAQIMWEIGAEEKVVGVTKHAMNLEGAEDRTNISTEGETINPEIVASLEPDLVLAPSSQMVTDELVALLREVGLDVYYYSSASSIADVRERTLLTGQLVGECTGAEETVEWMDHELAVVEAALDGQERPGVLYVFFGFTAGGETFIHEIIEAAGGTNIAANVGVSQYQQINEETVIEENPDWIVLNTNSPELPDSEAYETTTAVKENQTIVVNINQLNRPGPRIVHAIAELAEAFHPDAYTEAQNEIGTAAEPAPDEPSDVENGTEDPSTEEASVEESASEPPESPEDQPGFGVATGVVALIITFFGNRRLSSTSGDDV